MQDGGRSRIFYGWWIVLASSIIIFFGTGIGFYSFGVFVKPLQAHFGWSRAGISVTITVWALVYGFTGPVIGSLLHKYGARAVIACSAFIAGLCWLLLSRLTSLPQLFILMFFSGIGTAGITLIPNQTLISNWFDKYRGRAMGIMMVGIGLGGLSMPQLANAIIEARGWRASFVTLGLLQLAIIPVVLLIVRTRPADVGLEPDGAVEPTQSVSGSPAKPSLMSTGFDVKTAVKTNTFWLLYIAFALLVFGESGLTVHFVALLDDAGVTSQAAAFYWAVAVGISSVGRLAFGVFSERWNSRNLIASTHGLHAVAIAFLLIFFFYMGLQSAGVLLVFAILYGLSLGGAAVLFPVVVAKCFGMLNFSKLLGLLMSGFAVGVVGGPVIAGVIADKTGSYSWALIIFTVAFTISATAISLVTLDLYQAEKLPDAEPAPLS